jgi:hypothetical protein
MVVVYASRARGAWPDHGSWSGSREKSGLQASSEESPVTLRGLGEAAAACGGCCRQSGQAAGLIRDFNRAS